MKTKGSGIGVRSSMKGAALFALFFSAHCLLFTVCCFAGGAGTSAAPFLKVGVGARALGMAGAYAALSSDTHALYWNPAAVALIDKPQAAATYNLLYQDTSQGFLGYVHPTKKSVWGVGADYLQVADIEKRAGDTSTPDAKFTAKDRAVFITYAKPKLWGNLSVGGSAKIIQQSLDGQNGTAYAADLGGFYQFKGWPMNAGLAVVNAGTAMKLKSQSDPLPLGVRAGVACRFFHNKLITALGVESWIKEERPYGQLGLEYKPLSLLALRAGYQLGRGRDNLGSSLVGFSAGMGFTFRGLGLDYAYLPFGDLGNTNRVSLRYSF